MRLVKALPALLIALACQREERAAVPPPSDSLTVVDSFRTPESVLYDATMDVYVVSNINGSPFEKDGDGFLSRVGTDGRVLELRWVDGASEGVTLHAPKGMGMSGDTLFVADLDEVRLFDRVTGAPLGSWPVRGAAFLNDVAVGPDGTVYVTDTGLDRNFQAQAGAVYRFDAQGRATALARVRQSGPNGIIAEAEGVTVVMWSGEVARFDLQGRRTELPRSSVAQLDGVIRMRLGALVASAWQDSSIIRLGPGETAWSRVMGNLHSPADIGYDTRRNRILVPIFQEDRIEIRPLN